MIAKDQCCFRDDALSRDQF